MFFLNLPESVETAFADRGVNPSDIRYTARADVSKENLYEEIYLALTEKELCVLRGHESSWNRKERNL